MAILLKQLKDGRKKYQTRVMDELGKFYPSKTFETIREAERYERELKGRKDKREYALSQHKRSIEVQTYFDEWLNSRKYSVSPGWHKSLCDLSMKYILPVIGGQKLSDVKPPHIGRILSHMKEKNRSSQTMLHVFNILNKSFKDAVEYFGYLEKNPVLKQDRPKVHRKEREYLNPEDSWKLLKSCEDHYLGSAIWISILAGLRPSEVQALKWKNVDFQKRQILICAAFKRGINKIEAYPKQKNWLIVPMPEILCEYLEKQKRRFPLGFAAPAMRGGMLDYNKFYRGLGKLCREARVKKVSPQELRHSCTEIWFRHGATLEDVRRLLGHKSAETTRRYVHRTDDRLIKLASEIRLEL